MQAARAIVGALMAEVALAAESRHAQGSANSRRLRKEGRIPGVLYGHGIDPIALSVNARELRVALNTEAGANALIQLSLDGKKHLAFTRDVQKHPVRNTVAHIDFLVVNRNEEITAEVPVNFVGEAAKVTKMGGIVEHQLTSIAIKATAATLPAHIDVDLSELELDGAIRIGDINLPNGVTTELDAGEPIVVGRLSRAAVEAEATTPAEGAEAEGSAPSES